MQGFNMGRYVPPEHEGVTSFNKLANKHPLGNRASKSHLGILTVRFELPFPIWCTTCRPHPSIIGQGVRFNAEKKKVGNYFSTPIFSFTFKHTVCGGTIEIRTDPQNTAYVVHSGARKRDYGNEEDKDREAELQGGIRIRTEEEREELEKDAFKRLEGKVEDKVRVKGEKERIEELWRDSSRRWEDPDAVGRRLRKGFREGRKERESVGKGNEALAERMSLGFEVLGANEGDRVRARAVQFGLEDGEDNGSGVTRRPLFAQEEQHRQKEGKRTDFTPQGKKRRKRLTDEELALRNKEKLRSTLGANTRAAMDPFLTDGPSIASPSGIKSFGSLKRKRRKCEVDTRNDVDENNEESKEAPDKGAALVDYDSD